MKSSKDQRALRTKPVGARTAVRRNNSAGSKILSAITEATEILESEGLESERLTTRIHNVASTVARYGPDDVKRVRELLGASQFALANLLGASVTTVRSWEQGKRPPQPIASRFLSEIEANIPYWRARLGLDASDASHRKALGSG